ncbi:MAG: gephyrin-like molybdotransferase Glp [Bacteroidota bacterium]
MISVEEAKALICQSVNKIEKIIEIDVEQALNFRLAEKVYSKIDLPTFNQSNVDGYAVSTIEKNDSWKVIDEIKAGDNSELILKKGECTRIFTGAKVPEGSLAVIMQEHIDVLDKTIKLKPEFELRLGQQIRKKASQIKKGDLALEKNLRLNSASLSFLNMLGINKVKVYAKPSISLIITGNELQEAGTELEMGKVYESNSIALKSALESLNLSAKASYFIKDDKEKLNTCLSTCLKDSDVIILSGGISVGDYDFVKEVNEELKTETIFYKVAQKPGKPFFYGKNGDTLIFALPGNPASALTCFYEYILPALNLLRDENPVFLSQFQAKLKYDYTKKAGLAHFLKAKFENNEVTVLEGQDSFIMKSFAEANCFIYLPKELETIQAGELVEIHILPQS